MAYGTFDNNKAGVFGAITEGCVFNHELYGEKFYDLKVAVPRLSDNVDEIIVTVSDRLVKIEELKIGTFIFAEGQYRSYNNKDAAVEDNKLKLTVFAKEVRIYSSLDEYGKNPNRVFLNGYICKEPVYRKTPMGREICDLIIAVNRSYHKSDYIPIITWGRNARFCQGLKVGDSLKVWGRIQSRSYDKKMDVKVINKTAYEISVSKMETKKPKKDEVK